MNAFHSAGLPQFTYPRLSFTDMSSQADLLKAEGNALFVKGDLEAAFAKYTEALGYDDRSAVLYSNRAACCLGLDRCVFIPIRGRIG